MANNPLYTGERRVFISPAGDNPKFQNWWEGTPVEDRVSLEKPDKDKEAAWEGWEGGALNLQFSASAKQETICALNRMKAEMMLNNMVKYYRVTKRLYNGRLHCEMSRSCHKRLNKASYLVFNMNVERFFKMKHVRAKIKVYGG